MLILALMKDWTPDLKTFLILTFCSLFLLSFDKLGFLNTPKSLLQTLTLPIQYGIYKTGSGVGKQLEFLWLARKASLENKALRLQLGELLTQNADLRKQITETKMLIDSYNKLSPQTYDLLPARVNGLSRYLIVNKGTRDGVAVGQAVVYKDQYLGQAKSTGTNSSAVLLLTDPDSKIAVFSQGEEGKAKGLLQGQFGSELLMDKILHQEIIRVGDLVYSEGTEGQLPRGLLMGKVTEVLERQNEVFKQAKVTPIYKADDLDVVMIIKSS